MTDTYNPPTPPETPPPPPEPEPAAGKPSLIDRTWKTWSRKKKIGVSVLAGIVGFTAMGAFAPKEPEKDNTPAASAPAPETVTETVKAEEPSPAAAPAPVTPSATTEPAALPSSVVDALFIEHVEKNGIVVVDRESVIELGHTVCRQFDQGKTVVQVGAPIMVGGDMTAEEAGIFMGLSVAAYCPEHKSVFDQ